MRLHAPPRAVIILRLHAWHAALLQFHFANHAPPTTPVTAKPRVCFVIPTYNEAPNIGRMLQRVTTLYGAENFAFLVVDDDSPDGSGDLVRAFATNDARVHLLSGKRRGLGAAYVRGITHALEQLRAEIVVQMDADFSHDPGDAAKLIARVEAGAGVAIGSRYVAGGAVDETWSAARKLLSRGGNQLARWVAGLSAVQDCTAGFKALSADALRAARVGDIRVQGYAFQMVLLHRLLMSGARVVEEPIYFRERARGVTKLGLRDLLEFFYNVWWLRLASRRTFIKFALTGLTGVAVNLGSFELLLAAGVHKLIASPIAIELSIVWNFFLNNYWTFADRVMPGRKRVRGLKFNLVSLLTLALSYATFIMLTALQPEVRPVWLQGFAILPAVLLNYFLNSYWTFRDAGRGNNSRR